MKNILILTAIVLSLLIPVSGQSDIRNANNFLPPVDIAAPLESVPVEEVNGIGEKVPVQKGLVFASVNKNLSSAKIVSEKSFESNSRQDDDLDGYTTFEVYAGYSAAKELESTGVENGVNVSAVYNFHKYMGVKFDVSASFMPIDGEFVSFQNPGGFGTIIGQYTGSHAIYNVTGGIQFKNNSKEEKLKPFMHVLAGFGNHTDTVDQTCPATALCPPSGADFNFTGTSVIIGGGLDLKINRHIDIRLIQGDLNPIFYRYTDRFTNSEQSSIYANFRFGAGIVFKF